MLMRQRANNWLNKFYKFIAMLLVFFALLISGVRVAFPHLGSHFHYLQDYINQQYHTNIAFGAVTFDWDEIGPSIVAKNVSLLQVESTDVFVQFIEVKINFWRSLYNLQLVTEDVKLTGTKVYYDHSQALTLTSDSESSVIKQLATVFLEQIEQFTVLASQVIYRNKGVNRVFLLSELRWLNDDDRHQASGEVIVDGLMANNLSLRLDLHGNELEDMSGQAYLSGQDLNITPWLDEVLAIDNANTTSSINFSSWLTIKQGKFDAFRLDLGHNEISFLYNKQQQKTSFGFGQIVIRQLPKQQGISIVSSPLQVTTNNNTWQPVTVEAKLADQQVFAYISAVDLAGLSMLYPLFALDENSRQQLLTLQASGQVTDIYVEEIDQQLKVVASANDIATAYSQGIPGIKNLSGELVYTPTNIYAKLTAENGALDFDKHFVLPLPYQSLAATLTAYQDELGWHISSDNVALASEELTLDAELALFSPKQGDTEMALLATITDGKTQDAFHYYPHLLMGANLVSYLKRALVSGDIAKIQVLFNGPFSQFPFKDKSGKFNVDVELENSEFLFSSDWPAIENFNANLNFTNDAMMITGRGGSLTGLDVAGVKVGIASLSKDQVLTVDADFNNTLPLAITSLMNNSPLASSVGATLEQLVISKPIAGKFALHLPLNDTSLAQASGAINFNDNNIALQTPELFFTDVEGQLTFANEKINVEALSMNWLGLPVTLTVNAYQEPEYYATNIGINAFWQQKQWQDFVPKPLRDYVSGDLNWQGELALAMHNDGDFSYHFDLNSKLNQFAVNLPSPYHKGKTEQGDLTVQVTGQTDSSLIRANYGEGVSFFGDLNHELTQFSRSQINIGNSNMLLPMPGLHINANLDQASVEQWQPLISDIISAVSLSDNEPEGSKSRLFKAPEKIRGTVRQLDVYGHQLDRVGFSLLNQSQTKQTDQWLLQLNSDGIRGEVAINAKQTLPELAINAEYIHLKTAQEPSSAKVDGSAAGKSAEQKQQQFLATERLFTNMPAVSFHCDDFQIGKFDLGQVSGKIQPKSASFIEFTDLVAKRANAKFSGNGAWRLDSDKQSSATSVKAKLALDDLEKEFTKLDYASYIKDSGLGASAELNWQGGPQDFTLKGANGALSAQLDDGYIVDATDKGLRLLSVLSLESLLRKLTLDFRDIFSKGMFYSSINGDFTLQDGVLYTDNTKMKGTAGDLSVKGNTNLVAGILDYRMSYKPNITSSLPVIAWATTLNPVTFLAGLALNEVITSKVVSEINYEATGPLDSPVFKEVNRKTRDVRVGRSTPPEIIGDEVIIEPSPNKAVASAKAPKEQTKQASEPVAQP